MFHTKLKGIVSVFLGTIFFGVCCATMLRFETIAAVPAGRSAEDNKPTPNAATKNTATVVKVASKVDGVVLVVGIEIKEGEKVPPGKTITVQVGAEKKMFRPLKEGDSVKVGQLLVWLDDRVAHADLATKEGKFHVAKAELAVTELQAAHAKNKLETAQSLKEKGKLTFEDLRSAQLTSDASWFDTIAKESAFILAMLELRAAQTDLDGYKIASRVDGVIVKIHKRPGEGVRKFESILEIELPKADH